MRKGQVYQYECQAELYKKLAALIKKEGVTQMIQMKALVWEGK